MGTQGSTQTKAQVSSATSDRSIVEREQLFRATSDRTSAHKSSCPARQANEHAHAVQACTPEFYAKARSGSEAAETWVAPMAPMVAVFGDGDASVCTVGDGGDDGGDDTGRAAQSLDRGSNRQHGSGL